MKNKKVLLLALLLIAVMCMTLASCSRPQDYLEFTLLPDGTYEAIGKHFQGNPYGSMICFRSEGLLSAHSKWKDTPLPFRHKGKHILQIITRCGAETMK